jgi:hypothetical protein
MTVRNTFPGDEKLARATLLALRMGDVTELG